MATKRRAGKGNPNPCPNCQAAGVVEDDMFAWCTKCKICYPSDKMLGVKAQIDVEREAADSPD